jgi:hypothetical protein
LMTSLSSEVVPSVATIFVALNKSKLFIKNS